MRDDLKPYHHWVHWSDEDQLFIGYCPDLSTTGMCHGDDPLNVYAELIEIMGELVDSARHSGEPLPSPVTQPARNFAMQTAVAA